MPWFKIQFIANFLYHNSWFIHESWWLYWAHFTHFAILSPMELFSTELFKSWMLVDTTYITRHIILSSSAAIHALPTYCRGDSFHIGREVNLSKRCFPVTALTFIQVLSLGYAFQENVCLIIYNEKLHSMQVSRIELASFLVPWIWRSI